MIDQIQSRTIPIQSWAMVLAALITTVGIVFAACIQSGWIEKPSSASFATLQSSPANVPASATEAVEPINALEFTIPQPAAPNSSAYPTGGPIDSVHASAADSQPIYPPPDRQVWIVSEPDFIPVDITAESIFSPK